MSYNKTVLLGNVVKDPQLDILPNGTPVCEFTLATNRHFTDNSGAKKEESHYHFIQAWGGRAHVIANNLSQGDKLMVDGYLKTENWVDRATGEQRNKTMVVVEEFTMINKKRKNNDDE
jgi:single-strand DNA-binding protein